VATIIMSTRQHFERIKWTGLNITMTAIKKTN